MAIKDIKRLTGIIAATGVDAVEDFYFKLFGGAKVTSATKDIDYTRIVPKHRKAQFTSREVVDSRGIRRTIYDDFRLTTGIMVETDIINAEEALRVKAGESIYFNGAKRSAKQALEEDSAKAIKESIFNKWNDVCAETLAFGKYTSDDGKPIDFEIRPIKTFNYSGFEQFMIDLREEMKAYKKLTQSTPDRMLITPSLVDKIIVDEAFKKHVKDLGLAGISVENEAQLVLRVLNMNMKELQPIVDNSGNELFANDAVILLNTKKLYTGYAGVPILDDSGNPSYLASEIVMQEFRNERAASVEYEGQSAFTTIVPDPNSIWRIEFNAVETAGYETVGGSTATVSSSTSVELTEEEITLLTSGTVAGLTTYLNSLENIADNLPKVEAMLNFETSNRNRATAITPLNDKITEIEIVIGQ